jgi:hypothetical protein
MRQYFRAVQLFGYEEIRRVCCVGHSSAQRLRIGAGGLHKRVRLRRTDGANYLLSHLPALYPFGFAEKRTS